MRCQGGRRRHGPGGAAPGLGSTGGTLRSERPNRLGMNVGQDHFEGLSSPVHRRQHVQSHHRAACTAPRTSLARG